MEWKTYSVFISSTFVDMHSERDYLKMFVFPQINEELRKFSISLRVLDLRWGINTAEQTQETTETKVMRVCFDEIDRSRPFFIGLLGNRYGWIPPTSYTTRLKNNGFQEESSITAMEIEYAILRKKGIAGCVFMERDTLCLNEMNEVVRSEYDDAYSVDASIREKNPQKLEKLKHLIKQHLHEEGKDYCYQQYCPTWNGRNFENLSDFGEKVKSVLLREIASVYSSENFQKPYQDELNKQRSFLHLKLVKAYKRESVTEVLIQKINEGKGVLAISGNSGSGKSCIYAYLVNYFQKLSDRYIVLFHTTSVGMESRKLHLMLQRWCYHLETCFQIPHVKVETNNDAVAYFVHLIKKTPKDKKLLLFVDALESFIKNTLTEYLSFYPRGLSNQWMMICTTLPEHIGKISEYHRVMDNYCLPPLKEKEALFIIDKLLSYNGKELYMKNLSTLMKQQHNSYPCYTSPLWLNIALSRLISLSEQDFVQIAALSKGYNENFVDYVNTQINEFPSNEEELFLSLLYNLSTFYGSMPIEVFKLLSVSYNGLDEETIAEFMGCKWNPLNFATIRSFFHDFITEQGDWKSWQIMHQKCKLKLSTEEITNICQRIASRYVERLAQGLVVNDNVFYYLIQSNDWILTCKYFKLFYRNNDRIKQEILQATDVFNHRDILDFLLMAFSILYRKRTLRPKSMLFWELKEIVVTLSQQFNKIGKYEETILLIDSFREFLACQKLSKDIKSILFIFTESEYERAAESIYNKKEQENAYQQAINRATISGPLSLFLVPFARRYYKWQIFKLQQ